MTDPMTPPPPPPPAGGPVTPPSVSAYGTGSSPATAGSSPASAGSDGPIGKPRSAALVILLTIVTFGLWTLIWSYQTGNELKAHARTGIGGFGYLLITLFIHPVTMFLMAGEVEQLYRREGKEPPITVIWGLWFLLPIIGYFIWYVRIQKSINAYWASHGSALNPGL